jgi:glycosyltransferase involved in cell wall biosynthesis
MKQRNIVIIAPQSWYYKIGSNARNIALEFAKKNRVVYVNPPIDWNTLLRELKIRKEGSELATNGITQIGPNIWNFTPRYISASINWISSEGVYRFLNRWNNKRFAKSIKEATSILGMEEIIVFNDNYMFNGLYIKEFLNPKLSLYYIRDFLTVQPYFKKHGTLAEPELMRKYDAVVANSLYLKEYAESFNKKSFYVGQGCEVELFDENLIDKIPEDLKKIRSPVIGYIGFLTSMRLNIQLLIEIAQHNTDWNLVLVGPEDTDFQNSKLHQLKNVYFLGRRDPSELPAYVKGFDVCINPQENNQLTIGNYPRKVDEYLAMGKPTVATNTKAMETFKDYTYLAKENVDFIKSIEIALDEDNIELKRKRVAFARSHTWENSVNEIYKVIDSF